MKEKYGLKLAMSFFYSLTFMILFLNLVTKPVFEKVLNSAVDETGISREKFIVICAISTFLFAFVFLFIQTGFYSMLLKLFKASKENLEKIFPSVTTSASIVAALYLWASEIFEISNFVIFIVMPAATLLLNSVLYYLLSKDKKGFIIILLASIVLFTLNGLARKI